MSPDRVLPMSTIAHPVRRAKGKMKAVPKDGLKFTGEQRPYFKAVNCSTVKGPRVPSSARTAATCSAVMAGASLPHSERI